MDTAAPNLAPQWQMAQWTYSRGPREETVSSLSWHRSRMSTCTVPCQWLHGQSSRTSRRGRGPVPGRFGLFLIDKASRRRYTDPRVRMELRAPSSAADAQWPLQRAWTFEVVPIRPATAPYAPGIGSSKLRGMYAGTRLGSQVGGRRPARTPGRGLRSSRGPSSAARA
jgi:hypothetical protein